MYLYYLYFLRMISETLSPKLGDSTSVQANTRNLFARMEPSCEPFSDFGFIWEEICLTSINPYKSYRYALYIIFMIEKVIGMNFFKERKHLGIKLRRESGPIKPNGKGKGKK